MKKIFYLLPFALAFALGCGPTIVPPPSGIGPVGSFSGQFKLIHLHSKTGVTDTTTVNNLVLSMEAATGFKVTGDTTSIHAGSYGGFVVNTATLQIQFYDKTWPVDNNPVKVHLDGGYSYSYDGTTLQILGAGAFDTLKYYYKFLKTGN